MSKKSILVEMTEAAALYNSIVAELRREDRIKWQQRIEERYPLLANRTTGVVNE